MRQAAAAGEPTRTASIAALQSGASIAEVNEAAEQGEQEYVEHRLEAALGQVARSVASEARVRREVRESVIEASKLGLSTRQIAAAAGLSFQRIAQIINEGPEVPRSGRPKKKDEK